MKKTLQKFPITVEANKTVVLTEALKQDYQKTTGLFLTPRLSTDFSSLLITFKVEGIEILPLETDATIVAFTGNYPLKDAIYDIRKENIPARSSAMEFTVNNLSDNKQQFTLYVVLEND